MDKIKRFEIKASRWPWQPGYDWKGMVSSTAPLNANGARFGGGWKYKLGFATAGWTENGIGISFDLIFGIVNVRYRTRKGAQKEIELQEQRAHWKREREDRARRDADLQARLAKAASNQKPAPSHDDIEIPF